MGEVRGRGRGVRGRAGRKTEAGRGTHGSGRRRARAQDGLDLREGFKGVSWMCSARSSRGEPEESDARGRRPCPPRRAVRTTVQDQLLQSASAGPEREVRRAQDAPAHPHRPPCPAHLAPPPRPAAGTARPARAAPRQRRPARCGVREQGHTSSSSFALPSRSSTPLKPTGTRGPATPAPEEEEVAGALSRASRSASGSVSSVSRAL